MILKRLFSYEQPFFILLLLFLVAAPVSSDAIGYDVDFTPKLQKAYFEIQKLRLESAKHLIDSERAENQFNAFIPYLDNYADLHYLLISEDQAAYKIRSRKEDERLELVGNLPDNSPYKRFFQAEIRLHWAFAKMKFGDEVSGAWNIIKAYRLLEENRKHFPQFRPTLKSLGLLHALIGSVPDHFTWVTKVLGLKGNIQLGIQELEKVIREDPFFRQEAELVNLLLHAYTLQLSPAQVARVRQLPGEHPDNLLLHFFGTTILMKEGLGKEAAGILALAPVGPAYIAFPFLDYLRGELMLQKGVYNDASEHYLRFLKRYKGFNYIKDSNFKLFMCHWLGDRDQEAEPYIRKISQTGKTIIEADQLAQRLSEEFLAGKFRTEQKILYKARYATDGGFLKEASDVLHAFSEKDFSLVTDKAEYNYRQGRIFQKLAKPLLAIPYFERVITLAKNNSPGFGAASALQLGYIYAGKKDRNKAVSNFEKALTYKQYEYKNSIDTKARAALTKLNGEE